MKAFESYNPLVLTVYFLSVTLVLMFFQNPVFLLLSFVGAFSFFVLRNRFEKGRIHFYYFLMFLIFASLNPIFSHNGKTVLFVVNDTPITWEATAYGIVSAGCIATVLYWFYSFTQIMTKDKLLYVFGKLSPKLALVLSMGLRYVPLFANRAKAIKNTQITLGLYKDDNIIDKIKGDLRVFSILLTWALENGITTADSMSARGYGAGKRTHFSIFSFRRRDLLLLAATLVCLIFSCVGIGLGNIDITFYPSIVLNKANAFGKTAYIFYGVLTMLPTLIETEDRIKWKYCISKI